jgi:hypothetical protein
MSNEKYCQNCGAKNQPFAAVCSDCGNSFIPSSEAPQSVPPPPPPLEEPLVDEPLYEEEAYDGPLEPSRGFKKRYLLYAVLAVLSLLVIVGAISASFQAANRSVATPSIEASAIIATPTPTVSTSATSPAQPSLPDYASRLNTVGIGVGLTTVSPFQKVTINGKTAYTGTLVKNGQTYTTQVYPTSSYSEALAFKNQLISSRQSQGYVTYNPGNVGDASLNTWYGLSGNTVVSITAMPTSQIDTPLVLVMTPTT